MGVIIAFFHIPGTQATDSNCVNIRVSGKAMTCLTRLKNNFPEI